MPRPEAGEDNFLAALIGAGDADLAALDYVKIVPLFADPNHRLIRRKLPGAQHLGQLIAISFRKLGKQGDAAQEVGSHESHSPLPFVTIRTRPASTFRLQTLAAMAR